MTEVIEFVEVDISPDIYCANRPADRLTGRYVRESDYAALLERHRRLVAAVVDRGHYDTCTKMLVPEYECSCPYHIAAEDVD